MPKSNFKASVKMGEVVRKERTLMGLTQKGLADALDNYINEDSISLVESGKKGLSNSAAQRLMTLFNCDAFYLRGESKYKTQSIEKMHAMLDELRTAQQKKTWEYAYVRFYLEKHLNWRLVSTAGILADKRGKVSHPPIKYFMEADASAPIPAGMSFVPQFYIYQDESDNFHVLDIVQLVSFSETVSSMMKAGIVSMENNISCPVGWETDGKQIQKHNIINAYINRKEGD